MLYRLFFIVAALLFSQFAHAQLKPAVAIVFKCKDDGVWLRWAPTNATYWQLGNKHGYTIERYTLTSTGDMEPNSKLTLTSTPIKPYTPAEFLPLSEKSDEVATLEEILYGEESNITYSANDISSILSKNNELENKYGVAMLMCDLSLDAAKAGGLFYKDTKAVKGKRYIYRFSIASNTQSTEPVVSIIPFTDEKPLAQIKDLTAEFKDRTVTISWSTLLHKGIYTAYHIERSNDGKNFSRLSDVPYVHMTEKLEDETAFYVDSLAQNQKKYFYRIVGISPFAEVGPPSNVVSGEGKESLFGTVVLREGKPLNKTQVKLSWEFPKEFEKQINGFVVSRANNPDGQFIDVTKKPLAKEIREHIDATSFNNTYYIIKAVDNNGKEITRSFPYLVQIEDTTPPAPPVDITGAAEKTGIVKLTWKANTESDLLGYRVFRSNSDKEEPVEVTREILLQPNFTDTINIRVLDKKIYYTVVAVDKNYNPSEYSRVHIILRPDILPPAAPVFNRIEVVKDSIVLEWINSVSTDIDHYELTRVEKENRLSRTIRTWYPASPIEKFADRSLTPGHTYVYRVVAYDSAGNKSETISKEIAYEPGYRNAVTDVRSTVDRDGKKITLQWKNVAPSAKCIIYKKINNNPFTIFKTLEGNIESFIDTDIYINNTYSYKVQPVFPKGVKALISDEIKVIY
jgi:uncharacterized protein